CPLFLFWIIFTYQCSMFGFAEIITRDSERLLNLAALGKPGTAM
ncbi:hypothetical protein M2145_002957, partial [Lachnospiraceae bacterium PF1-21]